MKRYLSLLISALPNKNAKVTFDNLYKELNDPSITLEEFKVDLVKYMKKKVKKFTVKNNVLTIECFTKANINELVKYFKIGEVVKEVSMELLYESWTNPFDDHRNTFTNKLEKLLVSKEISYFIFNNALHIKE